MLSTETTKKRWLCKCKCNKTGCTVYCDRYSLFVFDVFFMKVIVNTTSYGEGARFSLPHHYVRTNKNKILFFTD